MTCLAAARCPEAADCTRHPRVQIIPTSVRPGEPAYLEVHPFDMHRTPDDPPPRTRALTEGTPSQVELWLLANGYGWVHGSLGVWIQMYCADGQPGA